MTALSPPEKGSTTRLPGVPGEFETTNFNKVEASAITVGGEQVVQAVRVKFDVAAVASADRAKIIRAYLNIPTGSTLLDIVAITTTAFAGGTAANNIVYISAADEDASGDRIANSGAINATGRENNAFTVPDRDAARQGVLSTPGALQAYLPAVPSRSAGEAEVIISFLPPAE